MIELLSIPAIVTAVEATKMAGLPSKWAGLAAIVIGAAFGFGIGNLVGGIILGLSASGLYSGAKAMIE